MLSLWVIRWSLHIDKIHKYNNLFLIIPTLSSKSYFVDIILHFGNWRNEKGSKIPALRVNRSVRAYNVFFSSQAPPSPPPTPRQNICVSQVFAPILKHFIVYCEQNVVKFAGKWGKMYWKKCNFNIKYFDKIKCYADRHTYFFLSWNLKHTYISFWPNQIAWNKHNDEEL